MAYIDFERSFSLQKVSNLDKNMTFNGFQRRASAMRRAVLETKKLYERMQAEIVENYSKSQASKMLSDLENSYNAAIIEAKRELREDLDNVVASRREKLKKSCSAPSEEDLRLLQALKMRNNLSLADIRNAASNLGDNLNALNVLSDIAKTHDVFVYVSPVAELEKAIDNAEDHCFRMLGKLDADDKIIASSDPKSFNGESGLNYAENEFYNYPDADSGISYSLFHNLDECVYVTNEIEQKPEKEVVHNPNAAQVTLTGDENLIKVIAQFGANFADVKTANPDLDLDNLKAGDKLIIPGAGRMRLTGVPGYVNDPALVKPVHIEMSNSTGEN